MFQNLVRQAQAGNSNAVEEIIEKLYPLVIASIKRNYNKENEYDDLIQMGYLKILESIYEYDLNSSVYFLGFVKMNLRFLYLDCHKIRRHNSLNEIVGEDSDELVDLIVDDGIDVLNEVIGQFDYECVTKGLKNLPNRQKQVILMYYYYEMGIKDISASLNISYRTVVNTKTKALLNLRKSMKECLF